MKKLLALFLALALCLSLGITALADGGLDVHDGLGALANKDQEKEEDVPAAAEGDGPALPRLSVYLDGHGTCEEGVADNAEYGMDDFLWATATVPMEDLDLALGYMKLLEAGPFQLELAQCVTTLEGEPRQEVEMERCADLAAQPDAMAFWATFDYAGPEDVGLIPGAMTPVGGKKAVGVMVQLYDGAVDISLFCGQGFRFAEEWEDMSAGGGTAVSGETDQPDKEDEAAYAAPAAANGDRDGTLPDPYAFFNGQLSYRYDEGSGQNQADFQAEELSLDLAEAYVALLSDPCYGLTLAEEYQGLAYGVEDYKYWKFDHTGDKDVGEITFFDKSDPPCALYVYTSTILNTDVDIRFAPGGFTFVDYGDRYLEALTDYWSDPAGRGRLTCPLEEAPSHN